MKIFKRFLLFAGVSLAMSALASWVIFESVEQCVRPAAIHVMPVRMETEQILAWPTLYEEVSISDLADRPYVEVESNRVAYITCFVPFSFTNYYLDGASRGLNCGVEWADGSLLTKGGMLRCDNHYYTVDYVDDLAMEIDLLAEKFADAGEPFQMKGFTIEAKARIDDCSDDWFAIAVTNLIFLWTNTGRDIYEAIVDMSFIFGIVSSLFMTLPLFLLMGLHDSKVQKETGKTNRCR